MTDTWSRPWLFKLLIKTCYDSVESIFQSLSVFSGLLFNWVIFLLGKEKCSTSGINVEGVLHVLKGNFILPSPACSAREIESISFTTRRQGQTNGSNYLGWLQCFSNTGFQTMKQSICFLISKYHCLINVSLQMTHPAASENSLGKNTTWRMAGRELWASSTLRNIWKQDSKWQENSLR